MDVILVDESDSQVGTEEKLKAHQMGFLHRAFSIFIFNSKHEMLIHRRALHKYHSGGLWTNACCSHPFPGESVEVAAARRLQEEMGLDCSLQLRFHFIYKEEIPTDHLIEHEFDHVFFGITDKNPMPNLDEVADFVWVSIDTLCMDVDRHPEKYTSWFKIAFKRVIAEHSHNCP